MKRDPERRVEILQARLNELESVHPAAGGAAVACADGSEMSTCAAAQRTARDEHAAAGTSVHPIRDCLIIEYPVHTIEVVQLTPQF